MTNMAQDMALVTGSAFTRYARRCWSHAESLVLMEAISTSANTNIRGSSNTSPGFVDDSSTSLDAVMFSTVSHDQREQPMTSSCFQLGAFEAKSSREAVQARDQRQRAKRLHDPPAVTSESRRTRYYPTVNQSRVPVGQEVVFVSLKRTRQPATG